MDPRVLEKYRLRKSITITELSNLMGKTPGWYSRIRSGKQNLSPKYITPMARIFGIKPERLTREYFLDVELEDTSTLSPNTA